MHLIYIDDSRDEQLCVFSALSVAADQWRSAFETLRNFRRSLKKSDGIFVHAEFHAWKFVSGRGHISDKIVPKGRRCAIFKQALSMLANAPGVRLFNAVFPAKEEERAYEWLLNRINRTLQTWDSHSILICDEGKEAAYTRLTRRMGVFNPIPSRFGVWLDSGERWRNVPIDRIIEDPFFKSSSQSYFIQMADFCAYSLLRRERPIPTKTKYGIHEAFNALSSILVREASTKDSEGIIRPK